MRFSFTKDFSYQPAPFHEEFWADFEDLNSGRVRDAAWLTYRSQIAQENMMRKAGQVAAANMAGQEQDPEPTRTCHVKQPYRLPWTRCAKSLLTCHDRRFRELRRFGRSTLKTSDG